MVAEAKRFEADDKLARARVQARQELESYAYQVSSRYFWRSWSAPRWPRPYLSRHPRRLFLLPLYSLYHCFAPRSRTRSETVLRPANSDLVRPMQPLHSAKRPSPGLTPIRAPHRRSTVVGSCLCAHPAIPFCRGWGVSAREQEHRTWPRGLLLMK